MAPLLDPNHSPGLAPCIEHTLLVPAATDAQITRLCDEARTRGLLGVCVNPRFVPLCRQVLGTGASPLLVTVVGFPLGASATRTKAFEAGLAVEQGADELDMVLSLGALKAGALSDVEEDIRAVVEAGCGRAVKVILECCELDAAEMADACAAAEAAGARFVKTSTGFGSGGARVEDVRMLRRLVGDRLGVKASGGIRDRAFAEALVAAGADRLGTSRSLDLIERA